MDQPQIDFDLLRDKREEIGAARTSIQPWQRGKRPQAKFMPRIARVLNMSLAAVVKALWKENLGELCPCGCGGKTVFPDKLPTARQVVLKLPCGRCGKKRSFSLSQHEDHRKFCQRCAHAGESVQLSESLRQLGIPKGRFYPWLRGELRPPQDILLLMMRRFKRDHGISEAETMKRFWGENIGDPCPCKRDCGGKKVLSDDPTARTLAIETPCAQCERPEAIRRYRYQSEVHSRLCKTCSRSNERIKREKFFCPGYEYKGVKGRTKNCPREMLFAPYEIRQRQKKKERNPNKVFDVSSRTNQCSGCASAPRLLATREYELRKFLPPGTKIRSRKQLSQLLSENHLHITPKTFGPDVEKIRNRRRRPAPGVTKAKAVYWWNRPVDDLPKWVRLGFCICDKIAFRLSGADKAPKWHRACWVAWKRTKQGKDFQSRKKRGLDASLPRSTLELRVRMPITEMAGTEDSLKISYAWTIQHYFGGKSYRTIADENRKFVGDHRTVTYRIKFFIDHLPAPELVVPRFQRIVEQLREASREETGSSSIAASNG